ncbi:hypothetical protein H8959_005415 [Pygathrix nigripes]
MQVNRTLRLARIRRASQVPALGFGQLSSLRPPVLVTGIPLANSKELLAAQGKPDHTYKSSSHTLMVNLLWMGHTVTVQQLKAPRTQTDVLLADLHHCRCGSLSSSRRLTRPLGLHRWQKGYPWGGPGPGFPQPPELYPWLPLELIYGDMPTTTSDLYSFCILVQEVFTGTCY